LFGQSDALLAISLY